MQHIIDRILAEEDAARQRVRKARASADEALQHTHEQCHALIDSTKETLNRAYIEAVRDCREQTEETLRTYEKAVQARYASQLESDQHAVEELACRAAKQILHGTG